MTCTAHELSLDNKTRDYNSGENDWPGPLINNSWEEEKHMTNFLNIFKLNI